MKSTINFMALIIDFIPPPGQQAQTQGWLNPDGEVIAVVLEAW